MAAILIVKMSSMGDIVHTLPMLSDIAAQCPDVPVDWLVEEAYVPIAERHCQVRSVIPIAWRRWRRSLHRASTWQEMRAFWRTLRSETYGAVVDAQGLLKSAVTTRLVRRLPEALISGYAWQNAKEPWASRFYDQRIALAPDLPVMTRYRQLAATALGYSLPTTAPDYGFLPEAVAGPPLAAPYAVLCTGTARYAKRWDDAAWRAVFTALRARGLQVVLPVGNRAEAQAARAITADDTNGATVLHALPLATLAPWLAGARCVLGVDTGLTHWAAALGRPTLALWVDSDPWYAGVPETGGSRNLGMRGAPPSVAEVIAALPACLAQTATEH